MSDPLAPIRARFVERAREDLDKIRAGEDVRFLAHRMAGTAATLGFAEVGALAGRIDDQMADGAADPADLAALIAALETLTRPA
ncbi:Hpt domain-containing protein [Phenylobacterium sp.]|jgi:HPt (histidine-containing phosphotransfer) domain-containing protein|uniref:Hpt domain-containing protein n=1 Tax=Phenylobacterium sp. TaxID=1871053 RepID=UPI0037832062